MKSDPLPVTQSYKNPKTGGGSPATEQVSVILHHRPECCKRKTINDNRKEVQASAPALAQAALDAYAFSAQDRRWAVLEHIGEQIDRIGQVHG